MGGGRWSFGKYQLHTVPLCLFLSSSKTNSYLISLSWEENNLVIIGTSSQVLFLLVVPLQCPDALKLVCTPLINFMVFLDNNKRMSLTCHPQNALINKAKFASAPSFSVETVALFLCTEQVVCVPTEKKKTTTTNSKLINIQSSPIQSRWSQQLWGCQQTQYIHLITSRYILQTVLWLWSIIFIFDQLSILNLTDLYCLPEGQIDLGESETNPKTPSRSPISNRFPYFLRPSVITQLSVPVMTHC